MCSGLWGFLAAWRALFDRFDEDESGHISFDEYAKALVAFGYRLSSPFVNLLYTTYDKSGEGKMSFDLFVQSCIILKRMTDVFKKYDDDRDGYITLSFEEFLTGRFDFYLRCHVLIGLPRDIEAAMSTFSHRFAVSSGALLPDREKHALHHRTPFPTLHLVHWVQSEEELHDTPRPLYITIYRQKSNERHNLYIEINQIIPSFFCECSTPSHPTPISTTHYSPSTKDH